MKYYKLLTKEGYRHFKVGKIYKDIDVINISDPVEYCVRNYPSDWQEVPAGDYFIQEGKMPEYFAIKRVADNPLWQKYIDWLNTTYEKNLDGNSTLFYYYGFDGKHFLSRFENNPLELTLEQWDQIVNRNKMEEFKLPENWYIDVTNDNVDMLNKWYKNKYFTLTSEYLVGVSKGDYGVIKKGHNFKGITKGNTYDFGIKITTEQFIKYVLKEEVMKENDKEIIGWKLKESYKKYEEAAAKIVDSLDLCSWTKVYNQPYDFGSNSSYAYSFKKAGVLELWFEPVYTEEFKVGDWITIIGKTSGGWLEDTKVRTFQITKEKSKYFNGEHFGISGAGYSNAGLYADFRKATPEEIKAAQTLEFGGYDVTFEKVTSGVRISCAGETGTLSQMEQIFNFITTFPTFKFGSQRLEKIEFPNVNVHLDNLTEKPLNIKIGCTFGTWKEFCDILEAAKKLENE